MAASNTPLKPEEITERQRAGWNWAARQYGEMLESATHLKPSADIIISTLRDKFGANEFKHLDVAASVGQPGMTIAQAFPNCQVLSTDLAEENAKIGPEYAAKHGLTNIRYETADAQKLPYPDGSFDVVTCNLGLMFMPEYQKALSEFKRVLKHGGILFTVTWGPREQCLLFQVTKSVMQGLNMNSPVDPSKFGDGEGLVADVAAAGFDTVESQVVLVDRHSKTEGLNIVHGTPVGAMLARREAAGDVGLVERVNKLMMEEFRKHGAVNTDGTLTFTGMPQVVITATLKN